MSDHSFVKISVLKNLLFFSKTKQLPQSVRLLQVETLFDTIQHLVTAPTPSPSSSCSNWAYKQFWDSQLENENHLFSSSTSFMFIIIGPKLAGRWNTQNAWFSSSSFLPRSTSSSSSSSALFSFLAASSSSSSSSFYCRRTFLHTFCSVIAALIAMDRLKFGTCDTSLFPFYLCLDPFREKCYLGFLTKHSSMPVLQEELQMSGADRWSASDYYAVTTLWFNTQTMENLFTVASFCRLSTVIRIRQTASAFWPKQTNKQTKWALEQRLDCTQSLCFWLIYAVRIAAIKRKDQTIDYQTISGDWNQTDCLSLQ